MSDIKTQYLLDSGELIDQIPEIVTDVLGKSVTNKYNDSIKYYLRFEQGHLVDPYTRDKRRIQLQHSQLRVVRPEVFMLYQNFLHTKRNAFLRQAEREI